MLDFTKISVLVTDGGGRPVIIWAEGASKIKHEIGKGSCGASLREMGEILNREGIVKAVNTAVRTGNTNVLNGLEKQIGSNGWIHVFTIGYILSFIDSFLLRRKMNDIEKES